ncbi:MAG: NAD+ synthase [Acidiferrobacterales bacterium]
MASRLRLAIGQLNLLVGDVPGNVESVIHAAAKARQAMAADAIAFPELTLTGYPPEDLLLRPALDDQVKAGLDRLCREVRGIDLIVGYPRRVDGCMFNAVSLIRDGQIVSTYHKHLLPNYSVFDEKRYFEAGSEPCVVSIARVPVGLTICEDVWQPEPARRAAQAGARLIVNINASPYHMDKGREREQVMATRARENRLAAVYVNLVGGQDELVFDGDSFVVNADGTVTQRCTAFESGLFVADFEMVGERVSPVAQPLPAGLSAEEEVYRALVLGVRDYVEKNRFPGVAIGLSGGIDSALTLCIAVDAIGSERVGVLMMPSRYTHSMSLEDAAAMARTLGVHYSVIPIEPMFEAFTTALRDEFRGQSRDVAEENIQARIRGTLLMAISNKTGRMVLTTGNKSEMAVGYATLYGDMAGGYAAIKDVFKTLVYRLAEYRNRIAPVIPRRIIERPPSAELAPDQKDSDSLPPYDVLDPILERYVEHDQSPQDIIAAGFDVATVMRVVAMVDRNEYKRRQAAPGVRISRRAFGRDRRYPITGGYREI